MPDPLDIDHARADAAVLAWENLEAERERQSGTSVRDLIAQFPHRYTAEPLTPGFCQCGTREDGAIHKR